MPVTGEEVASFRRYIIRNPSSFTSSDLRVHESESQEEIHALEDHKQRIMYNPTPEACTVFEDFKREESNRCRYGRDKSMLAIAFLVDVVDVSALTKFLPSNQKDDTTEQTSLRRTVLVWLIDEFELHLLPKDYPEEDSDNIWAIHDDPTRTVVWWEGVLSWWINRPRVLSPSLSHVVLNEIRQGALERSTAESMEQQSSYDDELDEPSMDDLDQIIREEKGEGSEAPLEIQKALRDRIVRRATKEQALEGTREIKGLPICLPNLGPINRQHVLEHLLEQVKLKHGARYGSIFEAGQGKLLLEKFEESVNPAVKRICGEGTFTLEQ